MKTCTRCNQTLDQDCFAWKTRSKNKKQSQCKECMKLSRKESYYRNKQPYINRAAARKKVLVKETQDYLGSLLASASCEHCGIADPIVLEFHHVDRETKNFSISSAIGNYALSTIKKEIAKCILLCANCHSRVTHEENQSWRTEL